MDNIIKNMNVKPMLDRAEFERLETPKNGENVNNYFYICVFHRRRS